MIPTWLGLMAVFASAQDPSVHPADTIEEAGTRALEALPDDVAGTTILANAVVMTATGTQIPRGYVVLSEGVISAIGEGEPPVIEGAVTVDAEGTFITPGLIDTHSHLGVYPSPGARAHGDGNEATAPTTAGVWAEHSFWPQDPGLQRAIAGGVTALQILPGSANLIGGRGVVLQMTPARGSRAMRFPGAPETVKMACGENPKRVYGHHRNSAPSTRMGNLRGQRQAFADAQAYVETWDRWAEKAAKRPSDASKKKKGGGGQKEGGKPPERNLNKETLSGVLKGRVLPQIHCYRADDMLSMMQLADEFGFQIRSFHHALEAYKIRDLLAEHEIASSTWADWWGFKLEAYDGIQENAALLTESGARAIIHSDSGIGIQRLNQEAAKAYHAGLAAGVDLSEDDALRWVTVNPAWALGIDDLTGTLEVGKRGDVAIWDGHPFSVYSKARWVYVNGTLAYDADAPGTWSDFEIGQEVTP